MNTLIKALILTEDRRFYSHFGIDLFSICRAFLVNLQEGRRVQGASTITQQLARTLYLDNRKTIWRKIKEVFIAFWLEYKFKSKEDLLLCYMGQVYMGHNSKGEIMHGFHWASWHYFKKYPQDLDIAEQAAIIAMIKGPNLYKPSSSVGTARRIMILGKMLDSGIITKDEFFEASGRKL